MRIAVVLAGGFGTRLWPISRRDLPKQFAKVIGDFSTYQLALKRSKEIADRVLVVTSEAHKYQALGQAKEAGVELEEGDVLIEPLRRDTAPAIYYALLSIASRTDEDPTVVVFPSDHMILNEPELRRALLASFEVVESHPDKVALIAVPPSSPEPGFGYIKAGEELRGNVRVVEGFVEKPEVEQARRMIEEGDWYWSTMIMTFKSSTMIDLIGRSVPAIVESFSKWDDPRKAYSEVPRVDVSSSVLARNPDRLLLVLTQDLGWSDLGSFDAIYDLLSKDEMGNAKDGRVELKSSKNNLVLSERLVALVGVENLVVVDRDDALLVMRRGSSGDLKVLIEEMLDRGVPEVLRHRTTYEPWGTRTVLLRGEQYAVSRVVIYPGKTLGPVRHFHRDIYCHVLSGTALVKTTNGEEMLVRGGGIRIPVGTRYEIINPGKIDLSLVEIAFGEYLGDDDVELTR